jgi:hypothetical protein
MNSNILQCQHPEFGEKLLLPNPRVQGVRRGLAAFQVLATGFDDRLRREWSIGHFSKASSSSNVIVAGSGTACVA